nr:MAG TPA: hypothetical protein [Caudoviricetes sp.]
MTALIINELRLFWTLVASMMAKSSLTQPIF